MRKRPNILQITTHDSGRHFGCYRHPTVDTPHIDRLAEEGARFKNCFTMVPICSPSRACQMTGLYPQRHGMLDLTGFGWKLNPEARHASQLFREAGYESVLFGLQHEVLPDELSRLEFDLAKPGRGRVAAEVAGDFADWLKRRPADARPFHAQVGFFETHTPFAFGGAEPDESRGVAVPGYLAENESSKAMMAAFQGAVRQADAGVGVLLEALRESGVEEETIVVFTTDHGIEAPRSKWFLYDPGIEIALILRYPGGQVAGGRTVEALMSNVDLLPTLMALAGVEPPTGLDGRSFAALAKGELAEPPREAVFGLYHKTQTRSVRTRRFKWIRHFDFSTDFAEVPVRTEAVMQKRVIPIVELYDLDADPDEFQNREDDPEYAAVREELDRMLWAWMEDVKDPLLEGPVRTPSYEESLRDYAKWKSGLKPS